MDPEAYLLPASARLIHIGPHKTGTSAVQSAFHANRARLGEYGVHYAGSGMQPVAAALAVCGGPGGRWQRPPEPADWTRLVREIEDAGEQRVVLSSEFFCHADDAAARRVVSEVSGGPVHVVITLRPLTKVLPSQWQQYVQNGLGQPYEHWLERMFGEIDDGKPTSLLWHRHLHGTLVRRWADAVGPEHVTVVVGDGSDPEMLPRVFEAFVGLPDGMLTPRESASNRSLTHGEVETLRLVVQHFQQQGWSAPWTNAVFGETIHGGAARLMRTRRPRPDEAKVTTPEWARRRAAQLGADAAEVIGSLGVRVIGDLEVLAGEATTPTTRHDEPPRTVPAAAMTLAVLGATAGRSTPGAGAQFASSFPPLGDGTAPAPGAEEAAHLPVDVAAHAVIAAIDGRERWRTFGRPMGRRAAARTGPVARRAVRDATAQELLRVLARRARRRVRDRLGR